MSVSVEQSAANARTASAVIARNLGFYENDGSGFRVGSLSRDNQVMLGDAIARYVVEHTWMFTEQALAAARYHLSLPLTGKPLAEEGMTPADYGVALLGNAAAAGTAVAGIGHGVLNIADAARWALPAAALLALVVIVWRFATSVPVSKPATK